MGTYYPPPDNYDTSHQSHHPLHEHTTVPDRSHNSYAAVLKPEPNYGLPEKPHQHKEEDKAPSGMETPAGYDYTPPKGYKAFENPTFPEKLYEAAEEILIVTPTTPKLTKGYIAPPQGY